MKNLFLKIAFAFILLSGLINGQIKQKHIIGIVKDNYDKPLEFVNVFLLNTFEGTMTEQDGHFAFFTKQSGNAELIISMIGYEKKTINLELNNSYKDTLIITLKSNAISTDEVIITASSFGSEKGKGVVMTGLDVLTTPGGAADIFQALKTMPGLTQVSESAELHVRGGDPIETVTLLDQASLFHPYTYESSYGGLFSNLNSSDIEGMYFSSGGFSAKYGNALSGVLALETKNEPTNSSLKIGLSLASSEFEITKPIIDDVLGIRINGRNSYTAPIFWLNGGDKDFTLAPTSQDISGNISYKFSQTGRIKTFVSFANDKQGVKILQPGYSDTFSGSSNNIFINTQITQLFWSELLVKSSFSFSKFNSNWKLGILDLDKIDKNYKVRIDANWTVEPKLNILFGYESEKRLSHFLGTIPSEDYDLRPNATGEVINASISLIRHGFYSEAEINSLLGLNSLFAIGGIRVDYIPSLQLSWVDPRINLGYRLNKNTTLSAGWGIFHQHPDVRLFSESDGNPNLKAMEATHYIVSFNYKMSDKDNIRLEAFYKDYKNLPLEDDLLNYTNNGSGYSKGIDLIIKGSIFGYLEGWLSYGLIDTKRKWMDNESLTSSDFDITNNFTLVAKFNLSNSIQIGINYKYATGKPYTPIIGSTFNQGGNYYEPIYGSDNSQRFKNYQRLDLRFTYLTALISEKLSVFYIEALNVLDIKNIFDYSYSFDYSTQNEVTSYFGKRTIVVGTQISF